MASISDVYNQLVNANSNLQQLHTDLGNEKVSIDAVKTSVDAVKTSVDQLATLQQFANFALVHLTQQEDTIICILEHISQRTCALLNEAHEQTSLQTSIQANTAHLLELYQSVHSEAALESVRLARLREQIEKCCPPEPPEPFCTYEPCPAPPPLRGGPSHVG